MALRTVATGWLRRSSGAVASRQIPTFDAEAHPGEWIALSEQVTDECFALAWRRVSGLTASEVMDLLAWLETSPFARHQVSYRTGEGFSVRFQ
jgi:hypothetical protein